MRRLLAALAVAGAAATILAGSALAESVSSNWAGYVVSDPATIETGASTTPFTFTSVTATWKQPAARCNAGSPTYSSFWVGLGGFTQSSLEQIGTSSDCAASGRPSYYAWYELVPAAAVPVGLKIGVGDTVSASVNVDGTNVLVQLKDRTRKTSFTRLLTMDAPDLTSAEWIAEAPSACSPNGNCRVLPLSDFGSVTFSRIATIANGHPGTITDTAWESDLIRLETRDNLGFAPSVSAAPSTVTPDGRTFAVTLS